MATVLDEEQDSPMPARSTPPPPASNRWIDLDRLLLRNGPLAHPQFDPTTARSRLENSRVLVIGAGGLGCEILKNLALSGFKNIDVIDMDTIDVSNLNRQFLFRETDVGKSKAEAAARFIMDRVPDVTVTPHFCKIQEYDSDFYRQFDVIVSGLDAIEPRRWINGMLVSLVGYEEDSEEVDTSTVIPLIDGGTEGFKGHARVILPKLTSCFECTLDLFPPQVTYPMCTIAFTPRLPQHCIEYASMVQWPEHFGKEKKIDGDNPEHIEWLYRKALERAGSFGIEGVTYRLTQGVIKNIIPAIASTNAIIAASCTNEAFKYVTQCALNLDDYMMFNGAEGIYTYTYSNEKKADCMACGSPKPQTLQVLPTDTLQDVITKFGESSNFKFKLPNILSAQKTLYMSRPAALEQATRKNLAKPICELVQAGAMLTVTDPTMPYACLLIEVKF